MAAPVRVAESTSHRSTERGSVQNSGFKLRSNPGQILISAEKNSTSTLTSVNTVEEYLQNEVTLGSLAGSFHSHPLTDLHFNRFKLIEKTLPGTWRLILDLSYPKGASVNDGITSEDSSVSFQDLDGVVDAILSKGKGTWLCKLDIARAYRNIPVHPSDRYLLGMRWLDRIYIDLALSFGGRPCAAIFSEVAKVIR